MSDLHEDGAVPLGKEAKDSYGVRGINAEGTTKKDLPGRQLERRRRSIASD